MTRSAALSTLGISILSVASSQLLFKGRMIAVGSLVETALAERRIPWFLLEDLRLWLAIVLLLLGASCWYLSMTKLPLSLMLPIGGMIAPIVSVGAWAFLGESLTAQKLAAILVIASGVVWLGLVER